MKSPARDTAAPRRALAATRRRALRTLLPKPWARGWWWRRLAAAALLAVATALALLPAKTTAHPTATVLVARRDLPPGWTIRPVDLSLETVDLSTAPAGALADLRGATGQLVTGAVRRGEILTDARLIGPMLAGLAPDTAAVPIRLADAGIAELLRAGSRVDLIAANPADDGAAVLASNGVVLLVPPPTDQFGKGRLILVALPTRTATQVARISLQRELAVTLR